MKKAFIAEIALYAVLGTAVFAFARERTLNCPLRQPVAAVAPLATAPDKAAEKAKIETISPQRALEMMKAGAAMIDVREPGEWATVRVQDSTLIPLSQVKAEPKKAALAPQILLMCHSGRRARVAADAMAEVPDVKLFVIEGGITKWQNEGLPVVKGEPVAAPVGEKTP